MQIRAYLEFNKIQDFYYRTNVELFTACKNFDYYGINWEFI